MEPLTPLSASGNEAQRAGGQAFPGVCIVALKAENLSSTLRPKTRPQYWVVTTGDSANPRIPSGAQTLEVPS